MPGMFDAHGHYGSPISALNVIEQSLYGLQANLAYGVTTMYDVYGTTQKDYWVSDMIQKGKHLWTLDTVNRTGGLSLRVRAYVCSCGLHRSQLKRFRSAPPTLPACPCDAAAPRPPKAAAAGHRHTRRLPKLIEYDERRAKRSTGRRGGIRPADWRNHRSMARMARRTYCARLRRRTDPHSGHTCGGPFAPCTWPNLDGKHRCRHRYAHMAFANDANLTGCSRVIECPVCIVGGWSLT